MRNIVGPKSRPAKKGIKTINSTQFCVQFVRKADPPKRGLRPFGPIVQSGRAVRKADPPKRGLRRRLFAQSRHVFSPKSRPAKKGIKTHGGLSSFCACHVRKADPPKRGLRHAQSVCFGNDCVRKADPPKRGLRPFIVHPPRCASPKSRPAKKGIKTHPRQRSCGGVPSEKQTRQKGD